MGKGISIDIGAVADCFIIVEGSVNIFSENIAESELENIAREKVKELLRKTFSIGVGSWKISLERKHKAITCEGYLLYTYFFTARLTVLGVAL